MADDDILRLDNQVCFPLYACTRLVTQAYRPLLSKLGLTYPQYLVMLVLWEEPTMSVSHIGERLFLDSGTLTPLLKRLEAQELLTRSRSERDERVVEVRLTTKGKRLKAKAVKVPTKLICNADLDIGDLQDLKAHLHGLLDKMLEYHARPESERS